jgi:ankyrin repeat protein
MSRPDRLKLGGKLIQALLKKDLIEAETLLKAGAYLYTMVDKLTPILSCISRTFEEGAILLLKYGFDINRPITSDGFTPLHIATIEDNIQFIEFLLKKGANIHAKSDSKYNALRIAVGHKHREIVLLLLRYGADDDFQSRIKKGGKLQFGTMPDGRPLLSVTDPETHFTPTKITDPIECTEEEEEEEDLDLNKCVFTKTWTIDL